MRILARVLAVLVVLGLGLWLVGPYEPADISVRFDAGELGDDLDAYLKGVEAAHDDITPGVEKRIVWAGEVGAQTPLALLYVHGFSASSEEIRPVPDRIAAELGANLVYTRLAGHGRDGDAMAEASVADWMHDLTEGLAVAKRAGARVVIIATSTGGTLVTAAAGDAELMQDVAGLIFVSPNYGLQNPLAALIGWPAARYWLPLIAGERRSFEPLNPMQEKFWTTEYPSVSVMPMDALISAVNAMDVGQIGVPALFHYSPKDGVVRPDASDRVAAAWGGPVTTSAPQLTEADDPLAHVIAGDVMSPGQTEAAVTLMLGWIKGL